MVVLGFDRAFAYHYVTPVPSPNLPPPNKTCHIDYVSEKFYITCGTDNASKNFISTSVLVSTVKES